MSNSTPFQLGAYLNSPDGSDPSAEAAYEANYNSFVNLMGISPTYIDSYIDYRQPIGDWVSNASFQAWSTAVTPGAASMTPVIGLPMASTAAGSETPDRFFNDFASRKYDSIITACVQAWAECGFKTQYWRPGWEFNLSSSASYATSDPQTHSDWVSAFQHIYTVLHQSAQQYGVNLQVLWNPSETNWSDLGSTLNLYPGNSYVDCIAVDVYADMYPYSLYDWSTGRTDTSFQQWASNSVNVEHYFNDPAATQWTLDGSNGHSISLSQLIAFAQQEGKPIAIAEAGAGNSTAGADNADDPAFVNWLAAELRSSGVPIEFVNIWDSNAGGSYEFSQASDGEPNEAAAWAADFGARAPAGPLTPSVAIAAQTLAQDTGVSATDLITSNGAVTLAGAVSGYAGTVVEVLDGTTVLGNATLNGGGVWNYATTLVAGVHSLSALAIDPLFETASSGVQPIIAVEITRPTVAIAGQNFVQATGSVTLSGTVSGASGTTVQIVDGTTTLGTAALNGTGSWSYATVLSAGTHVLHVSAVDLAGNSSASVSDPAIIVTGAVAPTVAIVTQLLPLGGNLVTLSGTELGAARTIVQIYDGTSMLGAATLDGSGDWTYVTNLSPGAHSLSATATDPTGDGDNAFAPVQAAITVQTTVSPVLSTAPTDATGSLVTAVTTLWRDSLGTVASIGIAGGQIIGSSLLGSMDNSWSIIGAADFHGTGNADVLMRQTNGTIRLWTVSNGQVGGSAAIGTVDNSWQIAGLGDFYGSGPSGILWRSTSGSVDIWKMADGQMVGSTVVGSADNSWQVAGTGDFYSTGTSDILWHNTDGDVAIWTLNNGEVTKTSVIGNTDNSWQIAGTGDFNGDGTSDILWRNTAGELATWTMRDGKVASTAVIGTIDNSWQIGGTGNYEGNGTTDILFRNSNGQLQLWNMETGTVAGSTAIGSPNPSWQLVGSGSTDSLDRSTDVGAGDSQRLSDILWQNTSGAVEAWAMSDAHVVGSSIIGTVTSGSLISGAGDFNGNGTSDILVRNADGSVCFWSMSNGQVASTSTIGTADSSWNIGGLGDFNGDGTSDLLWRNTTGSIALWTMSNGLVASSSEVGSVNNSWKIAGTGDFNGDGTSDILWRNAAGSIALWTMSNGLVARTSVIGNADDSWKIAGIGDFNGDGTSDILWESNSGAVDVWRMSNGQLASTSTIGNLDPGWNVVRTGDVGSNGTSDILIQNASGVFNIWTMSNGQVASTSAIGTPDSSWQLANAPVLMIG